MAREVGEGLFGGEGGQIIRLERTQIATQGQDSGVTYFV